jgi:tetratricopeptide (TPR) repeat protein
MWQDGAARRVAVAEVAGLPGGGEGERVRWYLEDYAEFPVDPAPVIAQAAETQLAQAGTELFRAVFADMDAVGIWERARDRLGQVRVEVEADPGEGPGLAWELLRDPGRDAPVALDAAAFVRTHLQAAGHPELPDPSGDRLRVLLVIARPGGRDDVPFRSVASRLVRGGAGRMEGLDLDMLRPATFKRLSQVLHDAYAAGRPYHVMHFDGHGTWLDLADLRPGKPGGSGGAGVSPLMNGVSVAGPVRAGQHGYLLFEDPASAGNQCLVDGPALGRLLTGTGVPVLVLNACRSAYSEARKEPGDAPAAGEDQGGLTGDVHARIRAYGSLAAEVADIGVPGVVAMRYNVYVVTAAQFMADLYAHLLAGHSLGQAAAAARTALAADPVRQIGPTPVALQDWTVPIVYESAPLVLLSPPDRAAPLITLAPTETRADQDGAGAGGAPRPPDAGFFGRDETLLALDRAFDAQSVVLLHAFAGAGKSATAAEFARWYAATGGLDLPEHPEWGPGTVLWSSFEHHLTAGRVIDAAGDSFATLLKANAIDWAAVTDPAQRRNIVIQVLAQVPVLWIWDNVEPVTGFPDKTPSDWTQAEQGDLVDLLRDLAQQTRCKVLVTSRRDENPWLGNLPARVQLPPMPMRESLQLAAALAARHGDSIAGADWRPLLRYAAGNPLTITVLVGQALRGSLTSTAEIDSFVARLRKGEAELEANEDAALGRTQSLAVSLSYGFAEAFSEAERARLAVLHLFRDTTDVDALRFMGDPQASGEDAVTGLTGMDRETGLALLDRAAGIGLLESLGGGYYRIHPALPWYFTTLFTTCYGQAADPAAQGAARAYTKAIGALGHHHVQEADQGYAAQMVTLLRAEEANLRHALDLARPAGLWNAAAGCVLGLSVLFQRTGRDGEWARLIAASNADFTDPESGGPLPGREEPWSAITGFRARIARQARDWPTAIGLLDVLIAQAREQAGPALAAPPGDLTPGQRNQIRSLSVSLAELGNMQRYQEDPECLPHLQEALALVHRIGDRGAEAHEAGSLGNAYLMVPGLRDLDQAEHWFQHSLSLRPDSDRLGRAMSLSSLGTVALEKFKAAKSAGEAGPVLQEHLSTALRHCQDALNLTPADDDQTRGVTENQLGLIYDEAGDTGGALRHFQQAIRHQEARGNMYGAGTIRNNIALLLARDGRVSDALLYARAALNNYQQAGPGAASDSSNTEQLIASLEQRNS